MAAKKDMVSRFNKEILEINKVISEKEKAKNINKTNMVLLNDCNKARNTHLNFYQNDDAF